MAGVVHNVVFILETVESHEVIFRAKTKELGQRWERFLLVVSYLVVLLLQLRPFGVFALQLQAHAWLVLHGVN